MSSLRRTYQFTLKTTVQLDDERLITVHNLIHEHVGIMYGRMAKEDIRVVLEHEFHVQEVK